MQKGVLASAQGVSPVGSSSPIPPCKLKTDPGTPDSGSACCPSDTPGSWASSHPASPGTPGKAHLGWLDGIPIPKKCVGKSRPQAPCGLGGPTPLAQDRPPTLPRKRRDLREKVLYRWPHPAGRRLAPQADPPGVGTEHMLPPAHHACVRALVDGVGDDAQVRLTQRQVARVGELQGLLVLVPAAGRREG